VTERELITLEDGTEAYKWPDGSVRRANGALVKQPPWLKPFDTERALAVNEQRWAKARQAVDEALAAHPDARTPSDGLRIIAEAQTVLASNPDAGHASTRAAQFVFRAGGYMRERDEAKTVIAIQVNVSEELARRYLDEDQV
jgi:hypothetical protein